LDDKASEIAENVVDQAFGATLVRMKEAEETCNRGWE
jgi:hypothetical protein